MKNLIYYLKHSGKSIEKISNDSGITVDRLINIINESVAPTMSDIRKIARASKKSIDFLISDNESFGELNLLFRENIKNDPESSIAEKFSHLVGNSLQILQQDKPGLDFGIEVQGLDHSYSGAEGLAATFRAKYLSGDPVSPVLNLPEILAEKVNCVIFITEIGKNRDGASGLINSIPFIFVSPSYEARMLFTLAHELGHLLMHHSKGEDFFDIDNSINPMSNKSEMESFANSFASCLLLPPEGVAVTIRKVREVYKISESTPFGDIEIILLSRIYGVSFDVAAHRCEKLELIPRGAAVSLSNHIKQQHGSAEKRAKELDLPPRPKIDFSKASSKLTKVAINLINKGELSVGRASEILSISISELYKKNSEPDYN